MRPELGRFIGRFDAGEYWAAHEELEPAWLRDRNPEFRGLIHLAAAALHAQRGNRGGARRKATSALRLLGQAEEIDGLALVPLRAAVAGLLEHLAAAADAGALLPPMPRLHALVRVPVDAEALEAHELPYRVRRYAEGYRIGRDPAIRDRR